MAVRTESDFEQLSQKRFVVQLNFNFLLTSTSPFDDAFGSLELWYTKTIAPWKSRECATTGKYVNIQWVYTLTGNSILNQSSHGFCRGINVLDHQWRPRLLGTISFSQLRCGDWSSNTCIRTVTSDNSLKSSDFSPPFVTKPKVYSTPNHEFCGPNLRQTLQRVSSLPHIAHMLFRNYLSACL